MTTAEAFAILERELAVVDMKRKAYNDANAKCEALSLRQLAASPAECAAMEDELYLADENLGYTAVRHGEACTQLADVVRRVLAEREKT